MYTVLLCKSNKVHPNGTNTAVSVSYTHLTLPTKA